MVLKTVVFTITAVPCRKRIENVSADRPIPRKRENFLSLLHPDAAETGSPDLPPFYLRLISYKNRPVF
jgi:hypothetical protein